MRTWPVVLLVAGLFVLGIGLTYDFWSASETQVSSTELERQRRRLEVEPRAEPSREVEVASSRKLEWATRQRGEEPPPSEEQKLYDRLSGSLRSAQYAFNHPDVMYLAQRSQITLTLAADTSGALAALRQQFEQQPEGTVKQGETKYAPVMEAWLRGKDFRIDPPGAQQRTVLLSTVGPTEWTWIVEPLETGTSKLLVLELFARLARGNETLSPLLIKTFEARINVDVRPFDRLLIQARRMTPVAQAFTGAGGLIAVVGFIGTARRWLKGAKKNGDK